MWVRVIDTRPREASVLHALIDSLGRATTLPVFDPAVEVRDVEMRTALVAENARQRLTFRRTSGSIATATRLV